MKNTINQHKPFFLFLIKFVLFYLIFTLIYKFYFNNPVPKKEEPKKEQIQIPSQTQTYKNQKIETVTNFENLRLFKYNAFLILHKGEYMKKIVLLDSF